MTPYRTVQYKIFQNITNKFIELNYGRFQSLPLSLFEQRLPYRFHYRYEHLKIA
nr:MAG TPA: hypothetical protein [Caudoviricetes sp.]